MIRGLLLAAALALPLPVAAIEVRRGDDALALALALRTDSAASGFTGGADVTANLGALQADFGAAITTGRETVIQPGAATAWRGSALSLKARWSAGPLAVAVDASRNARATDTFAGTLRAADATVADATSIAATLRPQATIELVTGAQSSRTTLAGSGGQVAGSDSVSSTARWTPAPAVTIEAGARLAHDALALPGATDLRGDQTTVQPRLVATIGTATATKWQLTAERVVTAPSAALLAAVVDAPAGHGLRPGSEWRLRTSLDQQLAEGLTLSTALTLADPQGAIELAAGPTGATILTGAAAGLRRQVDVGVVADLARFGLAGATLTGSGALRRSSVDDPLTRSTRAASGERPYEARLAFAQSFPAARARWGLDTYVAGPTTQYGVGDQTRIATTAGLGGFVDVSTGAVRVQFRVDNLVGGRTVSRTDYFTGVRGASDIDRVGRSIDGGRAMTISFARAI